VVFEADVQAHLGRAAGRQGVLEGVGDDLGEVNPRALRHGDLAPDGVEGDAGLDFDDGDAVGGGRHLQPADDAAAEQEAVDEPPLAVEILLLP
jgi:hypothetical protein